MMNRGKSLFRGVFAPDCNNTFSNSAVVDDRNTTPTSSLQKEIDSTETRIPPLLLSMRQCAFLLTCFCFLILVPAVRADLTYDIKASLPLVENAFEVSFTTSNFLTSTTTISGSNLNVSSSFCTTDSITIGDPLPPSPSLPYLEIPNLTCAGMSASALSYFSAFLDHTGTYTGGYGAPFFQPILTITDSSSVGSVPEPCSVLLLGAGLIAHFGRKLARVCVHQTPISRNCFTA